MMLRIVMLDIVTLSAVLPKRRTAAKRESYDPIKLFTSSLKQKARTFVFRDKFFSTEHHI
jgi:hypothetical protein